MNANTAAATLATKVGDVVEIDGYVVTVSKVQDMGSIVIVSGGAFMKGDDDGDPSLMIDVLTK